MNAWNEVTRIHKEVNHGILRSEILDYRILSKGVKMDVFIPVGLKVRADAPMKV
jgi:hypothetical protein